MSEKPAGNRVPWLAVSRVVAVSSSGLATIVPSININHVAMYLGREKSDGLQIMIPSTDGRSYRGSVANGYGVHDFRVPRQESKSKLVGYGTPPGIPEMTHPNHGGLSP